MTCPKCMGRESSVIDSRSKGSNVSNRGFKTDDLPAGMKSMDYRLRRHKCKKCSNIFYTIETYYKMEDIIDYRLNENHV